MEKGIVWTDEEKKKALNLYSHGSSIEEALNWISKEGVKPTVKEFRQWLEEFNVEKYVAPKRRPKAPNLDYVAATSKEKQEVITKMQRELKLGKRDEMEILGEAIENVGYHEANFVYPIVLEYLKRGKLVNAQMLITNVTMAMTIDAAMLETEVNNPSLIEQLKANQISFNKMKKLSKVLLYITEQDNHKNNYENYLDHLNMIAKRKEGISEYEEWLEQGLVIFPDDIKLKNRYVNFLLSQNRGPEALEEVAKLINKTDIYSLKEEDYIPYLAARSVYVAIEKAKQIKEGTRDFALAKSIAGETLIIDPGNYEAQLHLAHISLLEGNFAEAEMRARALGEQVNEQKRYSKKEREVIEQLNEQIMRSRIEAYGVPEILRQEDAKYGKHLQDSRYYQDLKQVQDLIYQEKLIEAKKKIDSLPINAQIDLGGRYVKMQYYIARRQYDVAGNLYKATNPNDIERKSYGAITNLLRLKDRIQSAEGIQQEELEK